MLPSSSFNSSFSSTLIPIFWIRFSDTPIFSNPRRNASLLKVSFLLLSSYVVLNDLSQDYIKNYYSVYSRMNAIYDSSPYS